VVQQTAFAAIMSVYNQTGEMQEVRVYTPNQIQPIATDRLSSGEQKSYNSWFNKFSHIIWGKAGLQEPKYIKNTPSSVTMTTGMIVLWPKGKIVINFDENGASKDKIKNAEGKVYRGKV